MSHHWTDAGGESRYATAMYEGPDFSEDFHTFALEWRPCELIWFVDGVERRRTSRHVPDEPMYLNVALAVGGRFPGPPDRSTPFPARLEVDYVQVYSLPDQASAGGAHRPCR